MNPLRNVEGSRSFRILPFVLVTFLCTPMFAACSEELAESGSCPAGYLRDHERVCRPELTAQTTPHVEFDLSDGDALPSADTDEQPPSEVEDPVPEVCLPLEGGVEITEVFANPEGADGDFEFVELLIYGDDEGDIWLEALNGTETDPYWQMEVPVRPINGSDHAGSGDTARRFVVGREPLPDGMRLNCEASGGCIQNGPDRLRVVTCGGLLLDEVVYPSLPSGASYAMCEATDQPDSGAFSLAEESPGESASDFRSDSFCQAECIPPGLHEAWIEQLHLNPKGADAGYEFIVVRAKPGVDVSSLELLGLDGERDSVWFGPQPLEDIEAPRERLILAGSEVTEADLTLRGTLQNGPDRMQLISCGDVVIDEVTWGDAPSAMIDAPLIPLPLDDELWIRCAPDLWWSLLIDRGASPIDEGALSSTCADAEAAMN